MLKFRCCPNDCEVTAAVDASSHAPASLIPTAFMHFDASRFLESDDCALSMDSGHGVHLYLRMMPFT